MSLHTSLPVYKASYDLFLYSFRLIKNLNREYKYTAGEKIKNEVMDLMMNIYRANKKRDKKTNLEKARESIEVIRLLFRLLKDLKQINLKNFSEVNRKIENVSRQIAGWCKSLN
jgi:four helix bundle protein